LSTPPTQSPSPTSPEPTSSAPGVTTTRPLLGIFGVLLGAMIATCTGRLLSVGLADLRGSLHLGVDEASWMGTAFNAAMMFIGPFSVYLGGLLVLLVLAGLTAGTFYPLTLSFVLRNLPTRYVLLGIAMYAIDILFTTNVATSLEAWYTEHLSWHWIFWNSAMLTPIMMVLVHFGIPWQPLPHPKEGQPRPNWRGFLYASCGFALLYVALDQGQRLNWMNSGTIVALTTSGAFLLGASAIRHFVTPNPLINFRFLAQKNTLILSVVLFFFRFVMLATVVAIPSYLASVQDYRPLQTGPVLLWVAIPQCLLGLLAMYLLRYMDARLILTAGFALVAVACLIDGHLSSAWSGDNFRLSQAMMAIGLALAFNAMVGSLVLELIDTGALQRPIDVLTFAGFFQTVRLFGGELGAAFMQHFIPMREQFHSNILGLGVGIGQAATDQRLLALRAGMASYSPGAATATERAGELLGLQVRQQAFTLAVGDSFLLIAWSATFCLLVIACMRRVPTQYRQVVSAPVGAV